MAIEWEPVPEAARVWKATVGVWVCQVWYEEGMWHGAAYCPDHHCPSHHGMNWFFDLDSARTIEAAQVEFRVRMREMLAKVGKGFEIRLEESEYTGPRPSVWERLVADEEG
jgi:hypothetical protein